MSLTFVQRVPFYARNSLLCLHTHHEVLSVKHFDMYSQFFMNSWDVLSIRFDMYSQFMNSQFMKHFDMYSQFSLISILNSWIHAQSTFAHIKLKLKMAGRLLNRNGILNSWIHAHEIINSCSGRQAMCQVACSTGRFRLYIN